jgi:hypothetical protein
LENNGNTIKYNTFADFSCLEMVGLLKKAWKLGLLLIRSPTASNSDSTLSSMPAYIRKTEFFEEKNNKKEIGTQN